MKKTVWLAAAMAIGGTFAFAGFGVADPIWDWQATYVYNVHDGSVLSRTLDAQSTNWYKCTGEMQQTVDVTTPTLDGSYTEVDKFDSSLGIVERITTQDLFVHREQWTCTSGLQFALGTYTFSDGCTPGILGQQCTYTCAGPGPPAEYQHAFVNKGVLVRLSASGCNRTATCGQTILAAYPQTSLRCYAVSGAETAGPGSSSCAGALGGIYVEAGCYSNTSSS